MRVHLLTSGESDPENSAAVEWLRARSWEPECIGLDEVARAPSECVLWLHARSIAATAAAQVLALRQFV